MRNKSTLFLLVALLAFSVNASAQWLDRFDRATRSVPSQFLPFVNFQNRLLVSDDGVLMAVQADRVNAVQSNAVLSATAQSSRRRAVRSPSPAPVAVDFKGTLDVTSVGALARVYNHLPIGAITQFLVIRPDGTTALHVTSVWNVEYPDDQVFMSASVGDLWNKPLPADWPSGVTTYRTIVTAFGQTFTMSQFVAVRMTPEQLQAFGPLGPLYTATGDASGGIILSAVFTTRPVLSSLEKAHMLSLTEGNDYYIPPGEVKNLPAVITGCSGFNGDTKNLWCSTVVTK